MVDSFVWLTAILSSAMAGLVVVFKVINASSIIKNEKNLNVRWAFMLIVCVEKIFSNQTGFFLRNLYEKLNVLTVFNLLIKLIFTE